MMETAQPSATQADPSADYQKTIRVKAHPGALFDALTNVSGLAAWWTRVTGSGDAGGELRFFFDSADPCVMHVDQATRPTSLQWTVTDCSFLPDWIGTRPTFTITPVDGDAPGPVVVRVAERRATQVEEHADHHRLVSSGAHARRLVGRGRSAHGH